MNKGVTLASHPTEEKFLQCTKNYTNELMKAANLENKPFIVVDQLLPSSNIERHMRYFNDIRVFVVDRDPRDLYLLGKYEWKDGIIPDNVELFCKWYKYARSTRKEENWNNDHIMFIQFEDLIYKYEETTDKIKKWLNLSDDLHIKPKCYFNPNISIKNTRYWEQHPKYKEEADQIEKNLHEYIYDYSEVL